MKVFELIEKLKAINGDLDVIIQQDSEGNGYSPLYEITTNAIYVAETKYSGNVFDDRWTALQADFEPKEWEKFKTHQPRCCVLFPMN